MRQRSSGSRSPAHLLIAVSAAAVVLGTGTGTAGALRATVAESTGRTPFPADRVALLPAPGTIDRTTGPDTAAAYPAHRAVTDLYVSPGGGAARAGGSAPGRPPGERAGHGRTTPDVVVRFADGFTPPPGRYQLSVLVGDPRGQRLAASLVVDDASAQARPVGRAAYFDGSAWRDAGPTTVALDALGFALIAVPLAAAPPGPAVWVEVAEGSPPVATRASPFFSRAAILGEERPGTLSGGPVGVAHDEAGRASGPVVPIGQGPAVEITGDRLVLAAREVPAEVGGAAVMAVVDRVRVIDGYRSRRSEREIRVDWAARTVDVIEIGPLGTVDRRGDRRWLVGGFPAAGAPSRIDLDLTELGLALGVDLDAPHTAMGVGRSIRLVDGRVVTGTAGVVATTASLRAGANPLARSAGLTPAADQRGPVFAVAVVTATVVALLALVSLIGLVRVGPRRRQPGAAAPVPAPMPPPPAPLMEVPLPGDRDRVPWAAADRRLIASAERRRLRLVDPTSGRGERDTEASAMAPGEGTREAPLFPVEADDVLAVLDLEVSDLRSRVKRS